MTIRLYDTLAGRKRAFRRRPHRRQVTMYVCGPTVYAPPHIGNARPAVVFDVLYRLLRHTYGTGNVLYARNITDVDDKINKAAQDEGVDISAITDRYAEVYHHDMGVLGVLPPTIEPRATKHIAQMITMIETLIAVGNAYPADGHVLFNAPSFKNYGALSRCNRDEMIAGARVEVAPFKKDPTDFVLWKPSTPDLPGWDSPWGRGRPGWHIECSAMSEAHLGETIDIHGGGHDLIFPHHENEIAQSTCAHGGKRFARYWMHNGFVNVEAEKMSKSIGNVLLVRDMLAEAKDKDEAVRLGEAIRLALLTAHYPQPLEWTEQSLPEAKRTLHRFYRALLNLGDVKAKPSKRGVPRAFLATLKEGLNTPEALAALHAIAGEANKATEPKERRRLKSALLSAGALLGVLQHDPVAWFQGGVAETSAVQLPSLGSRAEARVYPPETEIKDKIAQRNEARKTRDFDKADAIREELRRRGIELDDGPAGTTWRRAG